MKNTSTLLAFAMLIGLVACDKTIDSATTLPYPETSLESNAGNWKTYQLVSNTEIPVPAPEAANSAAYLAELDELKNIVANTTEAQKEAAIFWGGNGVARWHEIARNLAAQYNVPPNYNADGTYPAPDPANPTAYPRFPFANPPYASRAFALLAVAQYDALVAAWHYKFQYNRLAPYRYTAEINPLIPENDLPSYPSEDAVVAAASREVLKFLFPGEKPLLDEYSTEHKSSRLWAGANVPSDLAAGDSLGRLVAAKIIAYAKTDRMGQANNQAGVQSLRDDATARGITQQWHSLDLPARPPMLPFFGNVKPWNFNDSTKVAIRPSAPPAVGSDAFNTALKELQDLAKNRTRKQWEIASYWADGVGTYTPPGHWNRTASELILEKELNEIRSARAFALVATAIQDAGITCWDTKYYYLLPRPTEVDRTVTTSTGIPNFPAYTSGHSSFSSAGAEVLAYLFPDHTSELIALAKEASESRIYGCIHYRFDCEVGLESGKKVAEFAIERGRNDGSE
ncbi:MAG: phosphatase PAP2 family protein [Saprospiraceae bacterium]|nr:phosphatase PAP2 family protein [Saprospiraceae bacterium]